MVESQAHEDPRKYELDSEEGGRYKFSSNLNSRHGQMLNHERIKSIINGSPSLKVRRELNLRKNKALFNNLFAKESYVQYDF